MLELDDDKIKTKLVNMYVRRFGAGIDITKERKMHKFENNDCYGTIGSVLYSLDGSPPKGYALYVPDLHTILFLHSDFKRSGEVSEIEYIKNKYG